MQEPEFRIFLSSTFDPEMIRNRDGFRNELLAQLNNIFGEIGGNVYLNDLELGIPTEYNALKVIEICLNEIQSSDCMIRLIGSQRGTDVKTYLQDIDWKTSALKNDIQFAIDHALTISELEGYYALRKNIPSFFYIISSNRICKEIEYLREKSIAVPGFDNYHDLKKQIISDLSGFLRQEYCEAFELSAGDITAYNKMIAGKNRYLIDRPLPDQWLDSFLSDNPKHIFNLYGPKGSGRTTFLYNYVRNNALEIPYFYVSPDQSSYSLDEYLYLILLGLDEEDGKAAYAEEYLNLMGEAAKTAFFRKVLDMYAFPYLLIMDGLDELLSHDGISTSFCIPLQLTQNHKLVAVTQEPVFSEDTTNKSLTSFPSGKFLKTVFYKEGKILLYQQLQPLFAEFTDNTWVPLTLRLMASEILLTAKYYNYRETVLRWAQETRKKTNPYTLWLSRLDQHFSETETAHKTSVVKSIFLFLLVSSSGIAPAEFQELGINADLAEEILSIASAYLQQNTGNRYVLTNVQLREAAEDLWGADAASCRKTYQHFLSIRLAALEPQNRFDTMEELLTLTAQSADSDALDQLFINYMPDIANLYYYNHDLVLGAFYQAAINKDFRASMTNKYRDDKVSNSPYLLASLFYNGGYMWDGYVMYEHCAKLLSDQHGENTSAYATLLNNEALCLMGLEEEPSDRIEELLTTAYHIRMNTPETEIGDRIAACNNLCLFYYNHGQAEGIWRPYLETATKLCDEHFSYFSQEKINNLIRQAEVSEQSYPEKAITLYREAEAVTLTIWGEDNVQQAKILQLCGLLLYRTERLEEAEKAAVKAEEIMQKKHMYNDDLFHAQDLLGSVYLAEGRRELSKEWYRKAFQVILTISPSGEEETIKELMEYFPETEEKYWYQFPE